MLPTLEPSPEPTLEPTLQPTLEPALERYREIVGDWSAFAQAIDRPLPIGVWAHPLRIGRGELRDHLAALGMPGSPTPWHPFGLRLSADARPGTSWPYLAGLCHVQEEIATAAVLLLDPRPEERILDLCAAPGNKTAQIATALGGRGTVVARELEIGRIPALRNAVERLGLLNVATSPGDGAAPEFTGGVVGFFDAVLADVPCTSEGTSRKKRRVLRRCGAESSRRMAERQIRLLRAAITACRPGGRVVYSTCTYAPEENEAVVDAVLREAGGTLRLRPARLDDLVCSPGLTRWGDQTFDPTLVNAMRIWPHQNDTGGFFIAVLDVIESPPWATFVPVENPGDDQRGDQSDDQRGGPSDDPGYFQNPALISHKAPSLGEPADDDPAIASIIQRFGIPASAFENVRFLRRNRVGIHAVAADHEPPHASEPDSVGFLFVRDDGNVPKLTTAGALAFGALATRNVIELDVESASAFQSRLHFEVPSGGFGAIARELGAGLTRGYVIPRCGGHPLGVGWIGDPGMEGVLMQSQFPKGWSPAG